MIIKYQERRNRMLTLIDNPDTNLLLDNLLATLDERGDLNAVTVIVANNIAYNEYLIGLLQDDIAERGAIEEIVRGANLIMQANKSIAEIRTLNTVNSKLYNDLKILPREVKEKFEEDPLDMWVK
ncbi:MAG: hypothetical protein ACRCWQ_02625 [Bacilli bacterium]